MLHLLRTDSDNPDFIGLVKHLDADLAVRDGSDHSFYAQFNKIDKIRHAVVAYDRDTPVGCGAVKALEGFVKNTRSAVAVFSSWVPLGLFPNVPKNCLQSNVAGPVG